MLVHVGRIADAKAVAGDLSNRLLAQSRAYGSIMAGEIALKEQRCADGHDDSARDRRAQACRRPQAVTARGSRFHCTVMAATGASQVSISDGNGDHRVTAFDAGVVASFGDGGRWPDTFFGVHSIATDSKGNICTTETYEGKRVQRFLYKGIGPVRNPS